MGRTAEIFLVGVEVGVFTGTKKKPTNIIDVATYQSLLNRSDNTANPIVHQYGQIIIDECHHLSAPNMKGYWVKYMRNMSLE